MKYIQLIIFSILSLYVFSHPLFISDALAVSKRGFSGGGRGGGGSRGSSGGRSGGGSSSSSSSSSSSGSRGGSSGGSSSSSSGSRGGSGSSSGSNSSGRRNWGNNQYHCSGGRCGYGNYYAPTAAAAAAGYGTSHYRGNSTSSSMSGARMVQIPAVYWLGIGAAAALAL
ncbi:putative GPI-anchored protein 37 [Candida viswanathii]|uniref:Putative GPI-anchored protein 37 n=1 Tax=Candida viswanathii TaxID=5486 RepID=A0A367Y2Y6_9ASCO|nr:putative GPI-anchored protein 37 [Candida viswanathii]